MDSSLAIAAPIPEDDPLMTATLPASGIDEAMVSQSVAGVGEN
jgi:hypothetical protein